MKSHTVPQKLLKQFANDGPQRGMKWLWRYSKGLPPRGRVSTKSATRIDGHFSHPEDAAKEAELETRLNREFENPVNLFLSRIGEPGFMATDVQRKQLTFYVQLLFHRSEARRKASVHLQGVSEQVVKSFAQNESQVLTVAAKWNIDYLLSSHWGRRPLFTKNDVLRSMRDHYAHVPVGRRS
jgi:hypothetical protein